MNIQNQLLAVTREITAYSEHLQQPVEFLNDTELQQNYTKKRRSMLFI